MNSFLKMTRGVIPSSLIRSVLNKNLVGIGEVLEFELKPQEKTGRFKIQLAGEDSAVTIFLDDYHFQREGRQATIRIGRTRTDREWLQTALERFVVGKTFHIPEDKVELIDGLLG